MENSYTMLWYGKMWPSEIGKMLQVSEQSYKWIRQSDFGSWEKEITNMQKLVIIIECSVLVNVPRKFSVSCIVR